MADIVMYTVYTRYIPGKVHFWGFQMRRRSDSSSCQAGGPARPLRLPASNSVSPEPEPQSEVQPGLAAAADQAAQPRARVLVLSFIALLLGICALPLGSLWPCRRLYRRLLRRWLQLQTQVAVVNDRRDAQRRSHSKQFKVENLCSL